MGLFSPFYIDIIFWKNVVAPLPPPLMNGQIWMLPVMISFWLVTLYTIIVQYQLHVTDRSIYPGCMHDTGIQYQLHVIDRSI